MQNVLQLEKRNSRFILNILILVSLILISCENKNKFNSEILASDFNITIKDAERAGFNRLSGDDAILYSLETDSVIYVYEFGFENSNIAAQHWYFPSKAIAMENIAIKGFIEVKATCLDSTGNIYCFNPKTSLIYIGRYGYYKESNKDSTFMMLLSTPIEYSNPNK